MRKGQPGDKLWQPNLVGIYEIEPQSSVYFQGMDPMCMNINCQDHEEVSENNQQPAQENEAARLDFHNEQL